MPDLIRVAVIDDHPMFREGMVTMLMQADGIEVVGEGATAADALKVAQERAPDVILLDVNMPGGGIEAAADIARVCPSVRTIILTVSEDERDVTSALKAGARGYLQKDSSGPEVVDTLRAIVQGEPYVTPNLAARLLIKNGKRIEATVINNSSDLTAREGETFALVSRGMTNKEIAGSLDCGERTAKHHMTNIMQKRKFEIASRSR
jgi:two-component system, NarL family, nitrate/nitrite response regulator NarL